MSVSACNCSFTDVCSLAHSMTKAIVFYHACLFNSAFNRALALRLGIKWNLSTARHPQTDGQTERANRIIEDVLRHFVSPDMTDRDRYLCMAQFAMNSAWHETIQQTPFFLNHGRSPKTPLDIIIPHRPVHDNPASCAFAERLQHMVAKEVHSGRSAATQALL